jgi:NAD(P)H-hydrate epimerase
LPVERARVFVVGSEQSAARDAAAIAGGVPSRALMERAGAAAAAEMALRLPRVLARGVGVFAGPGNNGGDAWVVARALAATGVAVSVVEPVPARTPDAVAERDLALPTVSVERSLNAVSGAGVIVDGLLGTGSSGAPRGAIADAIAAIEVARRQGAYIVALDLPSGVDATSGVSTGAVTADFTLSFGTVKRGHLIARQACGAVVVLDIGLGAYAIRDDGAPPIVDAAWVSRHVPAIAADAHKGTRKKVAIIGGASGMAGAAVLAARAAIRSGVGMVRLLVAPESLPVVQGAEPLALAGTWPENDAALDRELLSWADGVVIGPGLGRGGKSRSLVDRVLAAWNGPVLLDADALNVFDGDVGALARASRRRPMLLTPHAVEFARLAKTDVTNVLNSRYDIGRALASDIGATVLLKGLPTVLTAPDGSSLVSAAGTPILAAAGSGDLLSGIAGTLLAQTGDALHAGAAAAWIHGRAAELVERRESTVRGATLDNVMAALSSAWPNDVHPTRYPVLLELPAAGERR